MAKDKQIKTNAMRILDKKKIPYKVNYYQCDEFIDGIHIADMLSQSYDKSFKTLVAVGKSKEHYVFCLPIHKEVDLKKAAKISGNKKAEMIPMKELLPITGYIRGGCSPIGMKKPFPTWFHHTCNNFDYIYLSAGIRGLQIKVKASAIITLINASTADLISEQ
jgi:Cys-tRNA(Pro)/Cys-tRNA(Cys) deacylase